MAENGVLRTNSAVPNSGKRCPSPVGNGPVLVGLHFKRDDQEKPRNRFIRFAALLDTLKIIFLLQGSGVSNPTEHLIPCNEQSMHFCIFFNY